LTKVPMNLDGCKWGSAVWRVVPAGPRRLGWPGCPRPDGVPEPGGAGRAGLGWAETGWPAVLGWAGLEVP
jgi:hypothetical protein